MTRILAADDDPGTREFYKILDVDMPGGGGKRVLGAIHLLSRKGLPVIFILRG